ncbi:TniQ family protein [Streptomyces sp. ISL-36]|nr:TniQ family protein [Streptomyces sp. ISL-36]
MIRHLPPPRLRRLPHTLTPLHRETWDSYVSRLATANRSSHLVLHEHINDRHRIHPAPLPLLDAISHLSGHPRDRLLKALPDLRTSDLVRGLPTACQLLDDGWHVQAVCTLCLAAKGVFTQARHWVPKSTRLCLRHGRWTDTYHAQFDVHLLPEITQAQRDHHHLVREHGWQTVVVAMRQATGWFWRWWDSRRFHQQRDRRLKLLIPPGGSPTHRQQLPRHHRPHRPPGLAQAPEPALHRPRPGLPRVHQRSPRTSGPRLPIRRRRRRRSARPLDRGRALLPHPPQSSVPDAQRNPDAQPGHAGRSHPQTQRHTRSRIRRPAPVR